MCLPCICLWKSIRPIVGATAGGSFGCCTDRTSLAEGKKKVCACSGAKMRELKNDLKVDMSSNLTKSCSGY